LAVSSAPGLRLRALAVVRGLVEQLRVEVVGRLEVVEAQRDFGLQGLAVARLGVRPGGEIVLGDAEPPPELAEELEGRDPVAGLDPRDVRRRAARESQLSLAEPGGFPRGSKAVSYRPWIVDVS
jgi:hypothetical protein